METGTVTGTQGTQVAGQGAEEQAPKVKTQRTYHIHARGNKSVWFTVLVYKGVLYAHPDQHAPECNSVSFIGAPKASTQVDSEGNVWVEIADPRK